MIEMEAAEPAVAPPAVTGREPLSGAKTAPLLSWVALAFAALIAPLAYAANLGFAPVTALAGLLCLPLIARARAPSRGIWLLIALLIWALASYGWSPAAPDPAALGSLKSLEGVTGLKLVFELALYASFALAMRAVPPRAAERALMAAAVLLSAMTAVMLVEAFAGAQVYRGIKAALGQPTSPDLAIRNIARACYVLALLLWPLAVFLSSRGRRAWAVTLAVGCLVCSVALGVDSPIAALIVSGVVFALVLRFGARALWACIAGVAIYFITAPVFVSLASGAGAMHETPGRIGKASWTARLQIWSSVDRLILAKPLSGWGLDSSRSWPDLIPLHPHDAAMQLWLELGPIGAGLAALFFAWLFSRIAVLAQSDRTMAAAAAASTTAYVIMGALSFGVWQEWWLAIGAGAIAVCAWAAASRRASGAARAQAGLVPL